MRNKIVIIIISFAFVILFWTKVYDNRTLKTSAENLIQRIETTCGKDFMNYIDYVEGMRQPREFRESKNASEFTIKLVVKKSCEDKVFDVIRRTTAISYDKMSDIQKDSKNIINNTIVFSINGQCEDVLGKNILFNSTIYKNGNRNYSPLDIELYGVKQENDKMVIYCTTHAKRDKLAWKIFDYLYCFGYGNVNHFAVFSLMMIIGIILSIVLVYVIKNHFIIRGKLNNAANIRKVLLFCVVIVFVGIAFFLNMIMNFPMLIRNSNFYNFRPNCVEASHTGIWKLIKYASYCKVTNGELIRSFIEMLSFVPIGMLLFEVFKKNRTIKSIVFVTSVSVLFELFGDWGYISHYYYQTLFYNILGGLTGLGLISLFAGIRKGTIIRKRDKMISCMPIALDIILFSFFIILGNTSLLGNVYPNYYCKINTDNLNVKLVNEECMKKNRSLYNVLAENQYDLYKNQYNLNINADVDEDCPELHCYYNNTEIENMLNRIGIAYYPNGNKKWFDNAASFTSYNEIADGIYENSSVYIEFDENENPVYSDIKSSGKWGLSIQHCQLIKDYSWYIMPSSDTQGLKRIVSIKDAYSKLCNGEGYAKGLVELCSKGKVDIEVKDVDIVMHIDNMNCYEHVYCFYIEPITAPDGTLIDRIYVPAMKSYY